MASFNSLLTDSASRFRQLCDDLNGWCDPDFDSTRIRADLAAALKRTSLERQLNGLELHTVQDILEAALEPWLKSSGYLPS